MSTCSHRPQTSIHNAICCIMHTCTPAFLQASSPKPHRSAHTCHQQALMTWCCSYQMQRRHLRSGPGQLTRHHLTGQPRRCTVSWHCCQRMLLVSCRTGKLDAFYRSKLQVPWPVRLHAMMHIPGADPVTAAALTCVVLAHPMSIQGMCTVQLAHEGSCHMSHMATDVLVYVSLCAFVCRCRFALPPTFREGKVANILSGNYCQVGRHMRHARTETEQLI